MKMSQSSYQKAKTQSIQGRCSITDLRTEIKKKFKARLNVLRNKQRDLHRNLNDKLEISKSVKVNLAEIQDSLLTDREATTLDSNSILKMLNEIEEEIIKEEFDFQAELYEKDWHQETNSIVSNLLNVCHICDKFTENAEQLICDTCASDCFNGD